MPDRRTFLKTAGATIAVSSFDFNLFAQSPPVLKAPLNTALLSRIQTNVGPLIAKVANKTATRADITMFNNQISSLRIELARVGFEPLFQYGAREFSGSDPRFSSSEMATQLTTVAQRYYPAATFDSIHKTLLTMPGYNPALPPYKLAGIMQGTINQLSIQGLDQYLAEVYQTLDEIGSLIYGNFPGPEVCQYIKEAAFFLGAAFTIIAGMCRFSNVLVEICAVAAIIAFVLTVLVYLIKSFFCGI